ncbi:MAG: fructose-bisphosphatase class II [candidate division Zixibacteria bacterium]|nr:fructose-bisphosphatase class II [candidate division Zixibacteria bacterium]
MSDLLFNVADKRLEYNGPSAEDKFSSDQIFEFNHRHKVVLSNYNIELKDCTICTLSDKINHKSNLGALRNRQLRQSVILSAALSAVAVGLHGRGSLNEVPKEHVTKELTNKLKRANDRTAAQVISEVLQTTAETLPVGEEVLIESTLTEGARAKPGKELGGNPTIAVGAVFGKEQHRSQYGLTMPKNVTLLSMGSDVVEGTTKSVMDIHSSMTSLFVTESGVKRHLPDIYVQRWCSGEFFNEFNPRETKTEGAAEIIANSYNMSSVDDLSAFFLDRARHRPAFEVLHRRGIATPVDDDGDLMPGIVLGLDGLTFPDGRNLNAMIGEIGGSAEWALGVLPLVWRGGQAIGMLTSQTVLTNPNLSPEERWKERFHFTEEEFMTIQDARFERKPYFTIYDIMEDPFAGGISAFGSITDNYYLPMAKGVTADRERRTINVTVVVINSLGILQCWKMTFKAEQSIDYTISLMVPPKELLYDLSGPDLEKVIGGMLDDDFLAERFRIFFNNEYYPALIPVRDKMVLLHNAIHGLIERDAIGERNREIVEVTEKLAPHWFVNSD